MNKFNRSRAHRNRQEIGQYSIGDLVEYHYSACGMEPCDLLAIVMGSTQDGYILIRFLDDHSEMTCVHSEISPVNET